MSKTKFFTNQGKNTLFSKFSSIFEHNKNISYFDALVGYFRSSGYFKLRPHLKNVSNIRILVGIDVDKLTQEMNALGLIYQEDKEKIENSWQETFAQDIQQANYDEETEEGIKQFINDILSGKVKLKAHPSQKIHAKIYIFRPDNFNEHTTSSVITGSSNLTDAGLGINQKSNYEFNVLLNDYAEVLFATNEFEKLWAEGVDILPSIAQQSLEKTHLSDNITPYELYLKCLIEYFGEEIEFDPNSIKDLPQGFKRLSYQMDAVNEGWEMLKKHNGFFLSDVVGLGKTMVATLIARQFLFLGGRAYNPTILLITPPALKQNWEDTLTKFEIRGKVKIFTNGSLHKITSPKDYDMVIIDEAHKFRNDTAQAYDELQRICKTKNNEDEVKKVMLISATPLNNRPDDLYNQILLFQDGNNSTLDFPLGSFFTRIKKEYKEILKLESSKARAKTGQLYEEIRERVIVPLMVRRTRTDLMDNVRYKKDLEEHNVIFPKTTPPEPIYYQLEDSLERLYDETIKKIDNKKQDDTGLLHTRYRALHYLKPELKQKYIRAEFIAERLVAIMKTLLLKRMDSSFYAFKETLNRFILSSKIMLKMIKSNAIIIAPNINISQYILEDKEDELMELLARESLTDPSIITATTEDFEAGFVAGVKHDHEMLKALRDQWDKVTIDPKIDIFLEKLPDFLDKQSNPEQKIVIFTESTDTMKYVSEKITNTKYKEETMVVSASNRNQLKQAISHNFDANVAFSEKKDDYKIILTTDVLAEGVNLHRANTVINYDTPWNATKLMQRIGRVNRIGQIASHIFVYNFYPTAQINDDIGLEKKALIKLQAFHSALGEDSQIYSTDEVVDTYGIFDENIEAEKNEIIPLLEEIRAFRESNPEEYKRIKDMPNKVRCGVKNKKLQQQTLVFARTKNKGSARFYKVGDEIENYGFINAAKLLKCTPNTKAEALHDKHYPQVLSALSEFEAEQKNIINQSNNKLLSTTEKKAINILKAFDNFPNANAGEKAKLKQAIEQIENKRFQSLVTKINKLEKNSKGIKPLVVLERLLNIINKYDVNSHIEMEITQENANDITPTIVISQSYV